MVDFTEFEKPLNTYIADFVADQQAFAEALGDENFPVYTQRLGLPLDFPNHQDVPHCIYFYYMQVTPDGGLDVRHYFYPAPGHDDPNKPVNPADWPAIPNTTAALTPILRNLIDNARKPPGQDTAYPRIGTGFNGIEWYRKSYVASFIDEENWELHQDSTGREAMLFVTDDPRNPTPNHSFFDGRNINIPVPGGRPLSTYVCINHMKRDVDGENLRTGEDQLYAFKLFFDVKFTTGEPPMTVIFDPDGNNLGPPIAPP